MEKDKASKTLGSLQKAARQVGDVHPKNSELVWTEYKPGKFDWRKSATAKVTSSPEGKSKSQKLQAFLEKTKDEKLKEFANKPGNAVDLRQMAYDELVKRGVDVSDINLNTGKLGKLKQQEEIWSDNEEADADLKVDDVDKMLEDEEADSEWTNPDYIKKKFGGLKTKAQRIEADAFIHERKTSMPNYKPPHEEIFDLNAAYYNFLKTDSPLMIASGGAGVGKSYNFHAIAEIAGKKPFNPEYDSPGDGDYDYVEAPEVKSDTQLVMLLKEHNGKIILFDDSDNVLKESTTLGIMKKATASSGKRIIGKKSANQSTNVDPFEFNGKIVFLTNLTQDDLTKDPNINAIYSRALKKDIQFTKREQLSFIRRLKHFADFTGVDRLSDPAADKQERDEVFDLIEKNIDYIDPAKFNSRTMKEALEIKRAADSVNEVFESDIDSAIAQKFFGSKKDWKEDVQHFLTKGTRISEEDLIEKASQHFRLDE